MTDAPKPDYRDLNPIVVADYLAIGPDAIATMPHEEIARLAYDALAKIAAQAKRIEELEAQVEADAEILTNISRRIGKEADHE